MPRSLLRPLLVLALLGCSSREGSPAARAADAATLHPSGAAAPAVGKADSLLARADAGRILGSATARVWMIVISDFQCPYCRTWHEESWAAIRKDYVDTGKLRVAYVNLPLSMHRNAYPAAQAAMCAAAQGRFWPMQDALFNAQQDWKDAADPSSKFEALARDAGANVDELRACVASSAMKPLIEADGERAAKAGANSTPTFFIGGRMLLGAQPLSVFREAIDAALAAPPASK